jgi:mannosyltransferase OCH1-like enzyme
MDSDESSRSSIPKITHRIWFQGWDKVPEKYQENVRLLEEMNPDFEHKNWDEQSLRRECELLGKPYVEKFDSIPLMIMKVDYGRYVVLYRYGGMSIDMDMKPIKSLNNTPGLDTEEMIVSKVPKPVEYIGYLNNAMFAVKPKSPIIKEMLDKCTSSQKKIEDYICKEDYLNNETGPAFVNKQLDKYRKKIKILDSEYFEPCYSTDPLCSSTEKTILDHRHSMSWIDAKIQFLCKFLFILYRFLPLVLILTFVVIAMYRPTMLPRWVRLSIKGPSS